MAVFNFPFSAFLCLVCATTTFCCLNEEQVSQHLSNKLRMFSSPEENKNITLLMGIMLQLLDIVPDRNFLHITAHAIVKWQNEEIDLRSLTPCKEHNEIKNSSILLFKLGSHNGEKFHLIKENTTFYSNGTILLKQKFEVTIPCSSYSSAYPFGSILCSLMLINDRAAVDFISLDWNPAFMQHPFVTTIPIENVNDLKLVHKSFLKVDRMRAADGLEKLLLEMEFVPDLNKLMLLFYLPSILILFICWSSILLGPMAITRATMNMGSLILLYFHYTSNMADLPRTSGISAVDVWKIVTIVFVVGSFFELVVVSCMASMGRSRRLTRCCGRRRSSKKRYDVEPLYEELNDLRQRRTRTTCSCCRYAALTVDLVSLIFFATAFITFTIFYFKKHEKFVLFFNGFDTSSIGH